VVGPAGIENHQIKIKYFIRLMDLWIPQQAVVSCALTFDLINKDVAVAFFASKRNSSSWHVVTILAHFLN
jgi:hypothetical protein